VPALQAGEGSAQGMGGGEAGEMRLFLDSLQEKLMGEFDALAERQKRIPPDEFNDDEKYKLHLNEVPWEWAAASKRIVFPYEY
jgi:hypothetical protein